MDRHTARRGSGAAVWIARVGVLTLTTATLAGALPATSQARQTASTGAPGHARSTGRIAGLLAADSSAPSQVHLKITLEGRTLYVALSGPGSRKVLVSYMAVYHGRKLASGERVVALMNGHRTVSFTLSKHTADYATIQATASIAGS